MATTYNPNVDYSELIAQEAAKGVNANGSLLAQYESQRNQKIQDQGLGYTQTHIYTNGADGGTTGQGSNGSVDISGGSVPSGGYYTARDQSSYINQLYDAAIKSAQAALKGAYDQSVLAFDQAEAKVPEQYRAARNQTSADAAAQRANMNEQFAASGLNTGATGQARLAMGIAEQNAIAELNRQQQATIDEITLQRNQARVEYETAVAQAIADNDMERAQALYQEAQRVDNSYRSYLEDALQQQQYQMNQLNMEATRQQMQLQQEQWAYEQQLAQQQLAAASSGTGTPSYNPQPTPSPSPQPQANDTPKLPSMSTSEALNYISRIPGLTSENKAAMLQDLYNNGRITLGQAQSIAGSLGFSV